MPQWNATRPEDEGEPAGACGAVPAARLFTYAREDGLELLATAERELLQAVALLQQVRELALKATDDALSPFRRRILVKMVAARLKQFDHACRIANYRGTPLLDGTFVDRAIAGFDNRDMPMHVTLPRLSTRELGCVAFKKKGKEPAGMGVIDLTDSASATAALQRLDYVILQICRIRVSLSVSRKRLQGEDGAAAAGRDETNGDGGAVGRERRKRDCSSVALQETVVAPKSEVPVVELRRLQALDLAGMIRDLILEMAAEKALPDAHQIQAGESSIHRRLLDRRHDCGGDASAAEKKAGEN